MSDRAVSADRHGGGGRGNHLRHLPRGGLGGRLGGQGGSRHAGGPHDQTEVNVAAAAGHAGPHRAAGQHHRVVVQRVRPDLVDGDVGGHLLAVGDVLLQTAAPRHRTVRTGVGERAGRGHVIGLRLGIGTEPGIKCIGGQAFGGSQRVDRGDQFLRGRVGGVYRAGGQRQQRHEKDQ